MITISHTHEDGTLVLGTSKGDGTAAILKANRFRWFPRHQALGPAAKPGPPSQALADRQRQPRAMQAAGFEVTVEIDDTPRDVTEVKANRAERLEDRREGLAYRRAVRHATEAERRLSRADEIAEGRPFGQPILVGHHSERRARADQKRINQNMGTSSARKHGKAQGTTTAPTGVVGRADAYRELYRPSSSAGSTRRRLSWGRPCTTSTARAPRTTGAAPTGPTVSPPRVPTTRATGSPEDVPRAPAGGQPCSAGRA